MKKTKTQKVYIVPGEQRRVTATSGEFETKRDFNFCANSGVQEEVQKENSIHDCFRLFLTSSTAESIVQLANLYARQLSEVHPNREKSSFSLKKLAPDKCE